MKQFPHYNQFDAIDCGPTCFDAWRCGESLGFHANGDLLTIAGNVSKFTREHRVPNPLNTTNCKNTINVVFFT
jgi:hypothetical protein